MNIATSNPCDALERPKTVTAPARGYSAAEVRRLLGVVPDTIRGRRDRAILEPTARRPVNGPMSETGRHPGPDVDLVEREREGSLPNEQPEHQVVDAGWDGDRQADATEVAPVRDGAIEGVRLTTVQFGEAI